MDLCGAGILLELNLLSPWYYPAVNIIVSIVREDSVAMAAVVHVFYTAMATYTVLKLTFWASAPIDQEAPTWIIISWTTPSIPRFGREPYSPCRERLYQGKQSVDGRDM